MDGFSGSGLPSILFYIGIGIGILVFIAIMVFYTLFLIRCFKNKLPMRVIVPVIIIGAVTVIAFIGGLTFIFIMLRTTGVI